VHWGAVQRRAAPWGRCSDATVGLTRTTTHREDVTMSAAAARAAAVATWGTMTKWWEEDRKRGMDSTGEPVAETRL